MSPRVVILVGIVWGLLFSGPSAAQQTGTVTLTWTNPTLRSDGSPYNNPKGSRVYWGTAPDALTNMVTVADHTLETVTIPNIPAGTIHFIVVAVNTDDVMSSISQGAILPGVFPGPPENLACAGTYQMAQGVTQTIQCK